MYRIAICDDDARIVLSAAKLIESNFGSQNKIYKYENPNALEFFIDDEIKGELDILIIDIELGNESGIKVAKRIKEKYQNIKIIFASEHANRVEDIFEVQPVYFLIKPFDQKKLITAINVAFENIEEDTKKWISIFSKGYLYHVDLRKTIFIESDKRKALIHDSETIKEFYIKLNEVEEKLTDNFCRCHQSYIVNMNFAVELSMYQITLTNGIKIPVSQSKYRNVKGVFMRFK